MESFNPLLALENASSTEHEISVLEKLRQHLCSDAGRTKFADENDFDTEWLKNASLNDGEVYVNPFPNKTPEDILEDQEHLNKFTFYLFERRYGWSEHLNCTDLATAGKDVRPRPDSHSGRCSGSLNIESKYKGRLNDLLDELLKWYLSQSKLSERLLISVTSAVTKASSLPVVRNQTVVHILEWLKVMAKKGFQSSNFSLVKSFIVAALTDVWSAIRNACVVRLPKIIDNFSILQLEFLFVELEQICQSKSSSWQAKEGAVMGMTAIIRSFHLTNLPTNSDSTSSPKFKMFIKFGKECLTKLPEFITDSLYSVVFSLLAHPQLSIREHASKAFTSILSRSEFKYIEKSFQQVVIRLCKDTGVDMSSQNYKRLPHHAVLREDFTFLDAYEAQGLLEVSIFLIKRIPVKLLVERWPLYFSTFNLYLMHPASTVRQASSVVFKYLVTKDSGSPSILRLVLQSLSENWETSADTVADPVNSHASFSNKTLYSDADLSPCCSSCSNCQSFTKESSGSTSRCKRLSIKYIHKLMREREKGALDSSLSLTWEWREGRLLAYELILKYLIANHIHYVFPSYALTYSSRHASCSVDEAVLKKTRGTYPHHTVQTLTGGDSTSSCSLPVASSMEILEEGQNVSGRSSAPGTRKEKDETLNSKNCELETSPRKRTSSFTKQESPNHASPRLVRQTTVGSFPSKTPYAPLHRKYDKTYFADSLLNKAKALDKAENDSMKTKDISKSYERLTKETETAAKWMTLLRFDSVYQILTQILYQTIECLEDSRWELRRMAQQILPLITETTRWFDITILEDFWSKYLSRTNPLFCYGGCIALKYSISHAGKLRQFIDQPPAFWKDIESCCSSAMNVFRSVDNGLQLWMPKVINLLRNVSTCDKITISAVEVLMTRQAFLPQDSGSKQKHFTDVLTCDVIISLFLKAHPDSPCASSLKSSHLLSSQDRTYLLSPDEFLSISSKLVSGPEQARQAERSLFLELHHLFIAFVAGCRFSIQIVLLPVLVHSVHSFCDDTAISHSLVQSIMKVADRLDERKVSNHDEVINKSDVDLFLDLAIWEFSFLITQRSIDLAVLKQLQEVFLLIFKHVDRPGHIKDVLLAVSTRLNYEPDLVRLMATEGDDDVSVSELQLLSNDIPTSPVPESPLLLHDEDDIPDDSVDRVIHESLALNSSHDSLANGPNDGYGREETGTESDDAFSDWDSCEELMLDNAREPLGEFVNQLWELFQTKENGAAYFKQELKKFDQAEKMIIESILESIQ